jgi:hypothetical protein
MDLRNQISIALNKTSKFLIRTQSKYGYWKEITPEHNEPLSFYKDIVLTSQAILALISNPLKESVIPISKGMQFIYNYSLNKSDALEWWALKLMSLKFSNNLNYDKECKKIIKYLANIQKDGYWYIYPSTRNVTNFVILLALKGYNLNKLFEKSRKWFAKNMAKDKKGWGDIGNAEKSFESFTSNAIIASIAAGEDPLSKHIQIGKKFLEETQCNDGSWKSSILTTRKPTVYATVIATLALILTSKDPFNKRITKGIKYILRHMNKNGGWKVIDTDKHIYFHTTWLAMYTLSFYRYLLDEWDSPATTLLKKELEPQKVTAYLFMNFEDYLKKKLERVALKNVVDSKILGTTINAISRRKEIINILMDGKPRDIAAIMDELKKIKEYSYLNKKHHMTQIKSDIEFLKGINLITEIGHEYTLVFDLIHEDPS